MDRVTYNKAMALINEIHDKMKEAANNINASKIDQKKAA